MKPNYDVDVNDYLPVIKKQMEDYLQRRKEREYFRPGVDWVQYSGPLYDLNEYMAAIKCLFDDFLILSKNGYYFEQEFCEVLGKPYGIVVNSGSSANLLMLAALKSERLWNFEDCRIIMPVTSFITSIFAVLQCGFKPVFVDAKIDDLNIDEEQIESVVDASTKAIHFHQSLGFPADMDKIMDISNRHDLLVLEDCCDAIGSTWGGKKAGSFGVFSSSSFYPAHHITMGEGGFIGCDTKKQKRVLSSLREWGRGCWC